MQKCFKRPRNTKHLEVVFKKRSDSELFIVLMKKWLKKITKMQFIDVFEEYTQILDNIVDIIVIVITAFS